MTDSEETEALGWAGDDPADIASRVKEVSAEPELTSTQVAEDLPAAPSTVWPVVYGIFAGIYVLYVVGWALYIFNHPVPHGEVLQTIMTELGEALAISAPIFWFFTTMIIVPKERKVLRIVWFVIGLIVLIPLPFMLVGMQ